MNNFYDKIELYLDNKLTVEEEKNFMQAFENDADLRKAVAEEQATRATIHALMIDGFRKRAVKEDLENVGIETKTQNEVIQPARVVSIAKRKNWRTLAIAASVVGIITTMAIFYNLSNAPNFTALAEKYTFDYPVPKVQDAASEKELVDLFYTEIKNGNYSKALTLHNQLPVALQNSEGIIFYNAYCLLKDEQFGVAKQKLQSIANNNSALKEAIEWYLLMAKLGEKQDIKLALQAIASNENHSYQTKAIDLLKELK